MQRIYQKCWNVLMFSSVLCGLFVPLTSAADSSNSVSAKTPTTPPSPIVEATQPKGEKYLFTFNFISRKVRGLENVKPGSIDISVKLANGTQHDITFSPDTKGNYKPVEAVLDLETSVKGYKITLNTTVNVLYAAGKKQTQPELSIEYERNSIFITEGSPRKIYLLYSGKAIVVATASIEFIKNKAGGGVFNISLTPRSYIDVFHKL